MRRERKVIRLQRWDYRSAGSYFVTASTKNRRHLFGEISEGKMKLSELGKYADQCFKDINTYNKKANVPVFMIMPDHIHAIVTLAPVFIKYQWNKFGPLPKGSLSSVINIYKGRVTKFAKLMAIEPVWQRGFYEHIIRGPAEYAAIKDYILRNPENWRRKK